MLKNFCKNNLNLIHLEVIQIVKKQWLQL